MGFIAAVAIVPCNGAYAVAAAVFAAFGLVAAAGCIFPFGFCGKAELAALGELVFKQGVELVDEIYAVVVAYFFYRIACSIEIRGIAAHYCLPQCLGYFGLAYEVAVKGYLVYGVFVIPAIV